MKPIALLASACLLLPTSAVKAQSVDACEKLKVENAKLKFENANLKKSLAAHGGANSQPTSASEAPVEAGATTQRQTAHDVSYTLIKCQGNSKAQTVTVTFLLTNSGINTDRRFPWLKAIDTMGEEHVASKTTIGSGAIITARLATGVPVKAVGVIPRILPTTKSFKLVTFGSWGAEHPGGTIPIEFRDVAITWN